MFSRAFIPAPLNDVREVSNYVAALDFGLKRLAEGFPLSLRLIKEMHAVLLSKERGSNQTPGQFRRTQNWIGGTRPGNAAFVPPPAEQVSDCLGKDIVFLILSVQITNTLILPTISSE